MSAHFADGETEPAQDPSSVAGCRWCAPALQKVTELSVWPHPKPPSLPQQAPLTLSLRMSVAGGQGPVGEGRAGQSS